MVTVAVMNEQWVKLFDLTCPAVPAAGQVVGETADGPWHEVISVVHWNHGAAVVVRSVAQGGPFDGLFNALKALPNMLTSGRQGGSMLDVLRRDFDDSIEDLRRDGNEVSFRLSGLTSRVTIRLDHDPASSRVKWTQSHFIHTPTQASPYRTSNASGDNEEHALRTAVRGFVDHFRAARRTNHAPGESWLVPNDSF